MGYQETSITVQLQRHFPLSNIIGYNFAKDKIIYVWYVQKSERAINASTAVSTWKDTAELVFSQHSLSNELIIH